MTYQITKGQTGVMTPAVSSLDTGWTADGNYAYHGGCNAGTMTALQAFGLVVGRAYVFTYTVDQITSGGVQLIAGTTNGTYRNAAGTYTETLTVAGSTTLSFFSDGSLRIGSFSFYDALTGQQAGRTITFNEAENKWAQEYGWQPEMMVRLENKLFAFLGGGLWLQNSNAVRNNFFGTQYSAQVTFMVNEGYEKKKLWYNLRFDSTGGWYVTSAVTRPDDTFPNGMTTAMTKSNVKVIDGKLWADILRDVNDPNFASISDPNIRAATAAFAGRMMQGGYLVVTLKCDDTTPATLASVETYYVDVEKSI